jgi:transcriptional regulator with XRE-family HTH domain
VSIQELADAVGLSSQQIRRIEAGTSEPTAVVLGRIARTLGSPVGGLLEHVRTIEEIAETLWAQHALSAKLEGSEQADYLAKKSILESMKLWED